MSGASTPQLDYITFLHGLCLVVLHMLCFILWRAAKDRRLAWMWLTRFASLSGLIQFLAIASGPIGHGESLAAAAIVLQSISCLCLVQFGRCSIELTGGQPLPRWAAPATAVLAVAACLAGANGHTSLQLPVLGLLGGAWALVALRRAGGSAKTLASYTLRAAAWAVMLYEVSLGLSSGVLWYQWSNPTSPWTTTGLVACTTNAILAFTVMAAVVAYYHELRRGQADAIRKATGRPASSVTAAVLMVVLVCGWLMTDAAGHRAAKDARQNLTYRVASAAACIGTEATGLLANDGPEARAEVLRRLRHELEAFRIANDDCMGVRLLVVRNGKGVVLSGTGQGIPGGLSPEQIRILDSTRGASIVNTTGQAYVLEPMHDRDGSWVSALAPVGTPGSTGETAVLEITNSARLWMLSVQECRLAALGMSLLLSLLCLVFLTGMLGNEEAAARALVSEGKFRSLVEGSPSCTAFFDAEGRFTSINPAGLERMGWSEADVIGAKLRDVWIDAHKQVADDAIALVMQGKKCSFEATSTRTDGSSVKWHVVLNPIGHTGGSENHFAAIWTDVTELREVENALRQQRDFLQVLFDTIPHPLFHKGVDGTYQDCNKAFEKATGLPKSSIVGRTVHEIRPPDEAALAQTKDDELLAHPGVCVHEATLAQPDGSVRAVVYSRATLTDAKDQVAGILGTIVDITEVKAAEERLRRLNECLLSFGADPDENITRLTEMCGSLLDGACAIYSRLEGRVLRARGQWNTPPDYATVDTAEGHICYDVIRNGWDEVQVLHNLRDSAYASTDPNVAAYGLQTYVGKAVRCGGTAIGSLCVVYKHDRELSRDDLRVIDIAAAAIETEESRKQSQEALRLERDKLEALTANMGAGMAIISPDFRTVWANRVLSDVYGDVIGMKCHLAYNQNDRVCEGCSVRRVFEENADCASCEQLSYDSDGQVMWVNNIATPLRDESGNVTAALEIVIPINERKRMEEALALEKGRLAITLRSIGDGVIATDTKGRVVLMNRVAEELTGWAEHEAAGKQLPEILRITDEESGETVPDPAEEALRTGVPLELGNHTTLTSRDGTERAVADSCAPIWDDSGQIAGAVLVFRDVTEHRQAEEAIRRSEERFRGLFDTMSEGCAIYEVVYGRDGEAIDYEMLAANTSLENMIGRSHDEMVGRRGSELFGTATPPFLAVYADVARTGHSQCFEALFPPLGKHFHVSAFSPSPGTFATVLEDITARKHAEESTRTQISAMNAASDQIVIASVTDGVVFANSAFLDEAGCDLDQVLKREITVWLGVDPRNPEVVSDIWETVLGGGTWQGEIAGRAADGSTRVEDVTVTPVKNNIGVVEHVIAIKRNITEKKVYEERLDHLAHHDPLTGLPNRLLFSDRLSQSLAQAHRRNQMVAVMFLDLDRFKLINDTMGHNAGDVLLWQVAGRLTKRLRGVDTIARMGGDEFTIILTDIESADDAAKVADRVLSLFAEPFLLVGREMFVSPSVGISLFPNDGSDVETLVRNADAAMYRAKEQGKNGYCLYTEALSTEAVEQITLLNNLRKALQNNEFTLHYQPRVDIEDGRILGVEALIRWQHPELGLVPPSQFIPLAEEAGLIGPISEWVLWTACAQNRAWQDMGLPAIDVAVNISARELENYNLVGLVKKVLDETGLQPQCLGLEVTESMLMRTPELSAQVLHRLKTMGVKISIDDFGTGHSSLSKLKRLPIDTVKIDQSFVKDITSNADDAAIASAVVAMAHSLKLMVVAEGVETIDQLEFLRSLKCDEVQGYFISRPVPADTLAEALRQSMDRGSKGTRRAA